MAEAATGSPTQSGLLYRRVRARASTDGRHGAGLETETMRHCRRSPCRSGAPATVAMAAALAVAGFVGGCGGGATPGDPVGEWAGRLVTLAGTCPAPLPARLLVGAREVSFLPSGGVLVLHGERRPDSPRLHAQLLLADMNRKPLPMVFDGILAPDGSHIDAVYGTPTCRARIVLVRPAEHPISRAFGG